MGFKVTVHRNGAKHGEAHYSSEAVAVGMAKKMKNAGADVSVARCNGACCCDTKANPRRRATAPRHNGAQTAHWYGPWIKESDVMQHGVAMGHIRGPFSVTEFNGKPLIVGEGGKRVAILPEGAEKRAHALVARLTRLADFASNAAKALPLMDALTEGETVSLAVRTATGAPKIIKGTVTRRNAQFVALETSAGAEAKFFRGAGFWWQSGGGLDDHFTVVAVHHANPRRRRAARRRNGTTSANAAASRSLVHRAGLMWNRR